MLSIRLSHAEYCCDENALIIELFQISSTLKADGKSSQEEDRLIETLTGKSCTAGRAGENIFCRLKTLLQQKRLHIGKP